MSELAFSIVALAWLAVSSATFGLYPVAKQNKTETVESSIIRHKKTELTNNYIATRNKFECE